MQTDTSNQNNNSDISLKRYAARVAMEGPEEKTRREAEEKIARDKELLEESIKRKEADKKAAEERAIKDKEAAMEREKRDSAKASVEIKTEIQKIKTAENKIDPLRTLKTDMDKMIREQSVTMARIAMEEDRRKREGLGLAKSQTSRNVFIVFASIVLIFLGAGAAYYIYTQGQPTATETNPIIISKSKPLIFSETETSLNISNYSKSQLSQNIKEAILNTEIQTGGLQKIRLTTTTDNVNFFEASSQQFFSSLESSVPGDLTRSLGEEMMLGVVNSTYGIKSGALIFSVDSYQNAFASMLKWENGSLVNDVYEIITSQPAYDYLITSEFEDVIINNQDTRVLRNENGDVVLVYGFLNSKTLVIVSNPDTFNEILTRFRNSPNQ